MKIVILIAFLILILLINMIFGKKIFSDDLIKGLSKKILKKVLIMAVIFGIGIFIAVQLIISSEKADSVIAEQERQLERQRYEDYQAAEFEREVTPFNENLGGVWYPYKPEPITNKDGVLITDYSIHLSFIDEVNGEVVITYMEGEAERSETLQINYHSADNPAFLHGMTSDIESKGGSPTGGGRFEIEEPRHGNQNGMGCSDCKDFEFRIGEESKLENFADLVFVGGLYSRTKSDPLPLNENIVEREVVEAGQETLEESNQEAEGDPVSETESQESPLNDDIEPELEQNGTAAEITPLAQKVNNVQGAWKRVGTVGEGDYHETHGVRYIFIKELDYGTAPAWRFTFETNYYLSTSDFSLTESDLELTGDQEIATVKRPDTVSKSEGFIIQGVSSDKIRVQYLDHSETEIVTEEFVKVSRNEVEQEFLGIYDALIGNE
jgi:hypothetical protein